jgi:hypothetical protein
VFALLVPSCCDKSGTSCYHFVTRLMTVTDLLQQVRTNIVGGGVTPPPPPPSLRLCVTEPTMLNDVEPMISDGFETVINLNKTRKLWNVNLRLRCKRIIGPSSPSTVEPSLETSKF